MANVVRTIIVLLAILLCPSLAEAEPTEAERDEARRQYHLGNDKYAEGDFRAAVDAFAKADAIMKVPTTGLGLGKSQAKVGLLIEAHTTLQRVAAHPESDDEPSQFKEARDEAAELAPDVARRIPSVVLQVSGVDGSTALAVELDGTALALPAGMLETTFQVNPGAHDLVVRAAGHVDGTASFSVVEAEKKVVGVSLAATTKTPTPDPKVGVDEGDDTPIQAVMWTGFALGVAGIVVGAVTGAMSLSTTSDLDAICTPICPESARPEHDRAIDLANASNATLAIGGVGIVVGVIALIVWVSADGEQQGLHRGPGTIGFEF